MHKCGVIFLLFILFRVEKKEQKHPKLFVKRVLKRSYPLEVNPIRSSNEEKCE